MFSLAMAIESVGKSCVGTKNSNVLQKRLSVETIIIKFIEV